MIRNLGRYQLATICAGTLRGREVFLDRMPYDHPRAWRIKIARHPVWLPFSERNGYRPGPRIRRLGPLDIAYYAPGHRQDRNR